ncbi:MAG: aminotransferase class I/II-fold pyridoxal phosphate-dependent enzyme [Pseudomonadota bacterium]
MRKSKRGDVDPFIVMDVMEAACQAEAAGRDIVHMEVGQPGTPAPAPARARLTAAMAAGPLGYTVALGLPALRQGIADLYRRWYGLDLNPERVVVTTGSSAGFLLSFLSLFDAGDRVAIGEPGYPSYRNILKSVSLVPVGLQTEAAHRFQPRPEDLTPDLAGLLVASPANPTGTMLDRGALTALIGAAEAQDIAFLSDEIYHGLDNGTRAVSALEISDEAYVINSFSKYFSMTGWRIGWIVVPETHIRRVERLAQNLFICPPHSSQVAALGALGAAEELDANVAVYRANRTLLLDGLTKIGFRDMAPPDGAFYLYANTAHLGPDSRRLSAEILSKAGVAVTPGLDFDPQRGHHTLRFSYAGPTERMEEGLARLAQWIAER